MAKTSVVVSGAKEICVNIDKILSLSAPEIVKAVNMGTVAIESTAKHICPVDTGNLRNTIHSYPASYHDRVIEGKVIVTAEYAVYVECGTGDRGNGSYPFTTKTPLAYKPDWPGQVAQPYLMPATLRSKRIIQRLVADAIKRVMKG